MPMVIGFDWHSTARLANKILVKPGREAANMWAMLHGKTIHYFSTTNHIHIYSIINIINLKRGSLPILLGAYAGDYWLKANSHELCRISGVCDNAIVKWWTGWRSLSHIAKNKNPRAASCFDAIIIINMSFVHSFIHSFFLSMCKQHTTSHSLPFFSYSHPNNNGEGPNQTHIIQGLVFGVKPALA